MGIFWVGKGSKENNKIYNNTVYGVPNCIGTLNTEFFSITNSEAKNNILFNCTSNAIRDPDNVITTSNNLTTDPLFVDLANDDYHVQTGSPAIDAGIILADVIEDYEGVMRPQGQLMTLERMNLRMALTLPLLLHPRG